MTDEWKAPAKASAESGDEKSWKLLEKTLLASVQEQRRSRRWGIFFKLLTFVYLFGALILFTPLMDMEKAATLSGNYTALIDVTGMIADKEPASAENIVGSLRAAFEDKKVKGVVLRINSPGGSPVQSGYVYDEIRRLRGLHPDTRLYAVISDLSASGAYYFASAADQIYADKASLVGSIGVTAAGYGFVGTMEKLGVERRTYTSGEHKSFLTRSNRKSLKKLGSGRACSIPLISNSSAASRKVVATVSRTRNIRSCSPGWSGRASRHCRWA